MTKINREVERCFGEVVAFCEWMLGFLFNGSMFFPPDYLSRYKVSS
jgi:hypothetical protein